MTKTRLVLMAFAISSLTLLTPLFVAGKLRSESFVGTYARTFTGAGGKVKETLVLRQNMTCSLRTIYPGSNRRPIVTSGSWKREGSTVKVTWRTGGQADNITFKLLDNRLVASEYDQTIWGAELKYQKVKSK
jgi:hypothetical protein